MMLANNDKYTFYNLYTLRMLLPQPLLHSDF